MTTASGLPAADLRQAAVEKLRKRRELQAHVLAYLMVNAFLVMIWWLTTPGGFFWPMFPMFGWGIGVVFHTWDVLIGSEPSEDAIRAEVDRLSRH